MTTKKGMTVAEARAKISEPFTLTLPSGVECQVRRLTAWDYIQAGLGDLPNEFYAFIGAVQAGAPPKTNPEEEKKNLELLNRFMMVTIDLGVLSPPMVFRYDEAKKDTHMIYSELTPVDQSKLMGAITGSER